MKSKQTKKQVRKPESAEQLVVMYIENGSSGCC